jgi:hypothetical protein
MDLRPHRLSLTTISPSNISLTTVSRDGLIEVYKLIEMLGIGTSVGEAIERQPGLFTYFQAIAIEIEAEVSRFNDIEYAKWWAHSRRFARFYLIGKGSRDTVDAVKDAVIFLFTEDRTSQSPDNLIIEAHVHRGSLIDDSPSEKVADVALVEMGDERQSLQDALSQQLWLYRGQGLTYEAMVGHAALLREELGKAQAVAAAMNQRGYRLGNIVEILKSGRHSIDDSWTRGNQGLG